MTEKQEKVTLKGRTYDKYCSECGKDISCYRHKDVNFYLFASDKDISLTVWIVCCSDFCTYKVIDIFVA